MMKKDFNFKIIFSFFLLVFSLSCKDETTSNNTEKKSLPFSESKSLQLEYAEGFTVTKNENFKILTVTKPWPKATKSYTYLIASKEQLSKMTFPVDAYDAVIVNPIKHIVVTSTTHIPSLELLGEEQKLVGFPGTNYISSKKTRALIDNGQVRELGKNEGINTEVLLETNPDLVVGFGVEGANKTFETIKKANIPVIYHGGWVESTALGKAEWIKFFGILFNKEKEADSIFNTIEKNYFEAKTLAKNAKKKPTVLSGAMTKDVWHLPNGNSPEAQFLKDANVDYLWKDTDGNGSLYLSFEAVLEKAKTADMWLSPSYYRSLKQMQDNNPLYKNFDAFKNKEVYSFTNTVGKTGGTLYYELGAARPDLILKDLIKIAHPELLKDYQPYFFKKFDN